MKNHPLHLIILFFLSGCEPASVTPVATVTGSGQWKFISDSLVTWYKNWHGSETDIRFIESDTGLFIISFSMGNPQPANEFVLATMTNEDLEMIPVIIRYDDPGVAAFFSSNLVKNRLTLLPVTITDPASYQIFIGK